MNMKKMIWGLLLAVCLLTWLLPVGATAAETVSNFTVTDGEYGTDYKYEYNTLTILSNTALTISNTNPDTATTDRIEVASGIEGGANITLKDVNIALTAAETPHAIKAASDINITIEGNNTLTAAGYYKDTSATKHRGVIYSDGNITIGGSGELNVTATATDGDGDGVYGFKGVTITGGTVTAKGDNHGIFGNRWDAEDGVNVTISGGTVTAEGGDEGIGSDGNVIISGGTVKTTATGKNGNGICGNLVVITGGTVTATATGTGNFTIGISGTTKLTIEGGTVTATGGKYGIGGQYCGEILISGGTVTTTAKNADGIAISSGYTAANGTVHGGNICISGGFVVAKGATAIHSENNNITKNNAVVIENDTGTVYGSPTITGTATIPTGATLTIPDGAKLTIGEGGVLVNNGTITTTGSGTFEKADGGIIYNSGTLPEGGTSDITLYGDFLVTDDKGNPLTAGADFSYDNGTLTILTATELTLSTPLCTAANPGSTAISVNSRIEGGANLTLNGVHISTSTVHAIDAASALNLTLAEGSTNTLTATGSNNNGIWGLGGDITIDGAGTVTAEGYLQGIYGITVTIGSETGKPNVTATGKADGICGRDGVTISSGTVTATGGSNGIYGTFSTGADGSAFIVTNSFRNIGTPDSGVIFVGDAGEVYGSPTIKTDATIPAGATLTVDSGQTLTIAEGVKLTNNGTIIVKGTLTRNGTISGGVIYEITAQPTNQTVNEGGTATFTVVASESPTYLWQQSTDSGANWMDISGATSASCTVANTTMAMNDNLYRCVVTYDKGTIESAAAKLTVTAAQLAAPQNLQWDGTTAQWDAVANASGYSVQLFKDNGTTAIETQDISTGTSCTFDSLTNPTAGSYTFKVTAKGTGNYRDSQPSSPSAALTYHAVTFNTNDGSEAPQQQVVVSGGKVNKPADPTKTGHTLDGWYNGETKWDFENDTVQASMTLTAKWTASTYTVTLNTNGGTINSGDVTGYTYGIGATLPTDVSKTGYTFMGWYAASDFSGTAVTAISISDTGNKEYWAKWTADAYNAIFDANGGAWSDGSTSKTVPTAFGEAITAPEAPVRVDYVFAGWSPVVGNMTAEGMSFTAQWTWSKTNVAVTIQRTAAANPDAGEATPIRVGDTVAVTATAALAPQNGNTRATPSFTFYNGDPDNGGSKLDEVAATQDASTGNYTATLDGLKIDAAGSYTIYAVFSGTTGMDGSTGYASFTAEAAIYTVSFSEQGIDPQYVVSGNKAVEPTAPIKTGYTFAGWYADSSFAGNPWDFENNTVTGTLTLYANWKPITYTISLPNGDGKGEGYTVTPTAGSASPVAYNGSYSFTVTLDSAYKQGDTFAVRANNGEPLTADANGVYTISNILANQSITAEGVVTKSSEVGFAEVTVNGYIGTLDAASDTISVLLPAGSNLSTAQVVVTSAAGTTVSNPVSSDDGATWTFTVTAEDGTTKTYTIKVSVADVLTITNPGAKTYGDAAFELSAIGGSGNSVVIFTSSDDTVLSVSGNTATIRKAGTVTITATKAQDGQYAEQTATLGLTISKKALTIKVDDLSVSVGDAPLFTYKTMPEMLVSDDTLTNVVYTAADTSKAGSQNITITNYTLTNADSYEVTLQPGTLTIGQKALAAPTNIRWDGTTAKWDAVANAKSYLVQPYANGVKTGEPVPATETNCVFTINAAGSYTFTVCAVGDGTNYSNSQESAQSDELVAYAVTLETNGGTINNGDVKVYVRGIGATLPTDVTKLNHKFAGWFEKNDFSGMAATTINTTDTGNKTFYAKWLSSNAGITAVSVGGTPGTIDATSNTISVVLPAGSTIPTDSSAVSITPAAGASVSNLQASDSGATWTFTVTAEDGTTANYTIHVSIAATAPVITTTTLANGTVGTAYSQTLTATGDTPITWSIKAETALPNGLTLDGATGVISGTPTASGALTFTVVATNAGGTDEQELSIIVNAAAPTYYSITVQNDGNGTASASPATAAQGDTVTLTATANSGYHFKEWQVVSGNVSITNNQFAMPASDVTVKAIFEQDAPLTYTITFKYNDGTARESTSQTGTDGKLTSLPTLTWPGYIFGGWYTGATGGTQITTDTVFTANTTVYAHWSRCNHPGVSASCSTTVICPYCGGSVWGGAHNYLIGPYVNTDPQGHYRCCKYCGEPFRDVDMKPHEYDDDYDADCNVCGYLREAVAKVYTITFDFNNGDGQTTTAQTGEDGKLISLPTLTWPGYIFGGWYATADGQTAITTDTVFTADTTVYAKWTLCDHVGSTNQPDCTNATTCSLCGAAIPALGHDFANGPWINTDPNGHYRKCIRCTETDITNIVPHIYDDDYDADCNVCGYLREVAARTYTITWVNADGTVLETDTNVAYGVTPSYDGATPTKAADAQFTYTFAGWTPEITAVTGNAIYTATFTTAVNSYTVTWVNADGAELEKDENVPYGTMPSYDGATPTKPGDSQYSYVFVGWQPEVVPVTGNATYTATFADSTNTYTVTWLNADGTELEKDENVPYGTMPSYNGATPTKPSDGQYTYAFAGWTPELTAVIGDVTYTATFAIDTMLITIVTQPQDQYVVEGQQATFSIVAQGDGITYQWYINRKDGRGWRELDGATGASYTTSTVDLDCDGFGYGCLVSDAYGNSLKSDAAVLHVDKAPNIPDTGDRSHPLLYLALIFMGGAGLLLLEKKKRRA